MSISKILDIIIIAITCFVCSVIESLLGFICDWNTNAKHSFVSQTGIYTFNFTPNFEGVIKWIVIK